MQVWKSGDVVENGFGRMVLSSGPGLFKTSSVLSEDSPHVRPSELLRFVLTSHWAIRGGINIMLIHVWRRFGIGKRFWDLKCDVQIGVAECLGPVNYATPFFILVSHNALQ